MRRIILLLLLLLLPLTAQADYIYPQEKTDWGHITLAVYEENPAIFWIDEIRYGDHTLRSCSEYVAILDETTQQEHYCLAEWVGDGEEAEGCAAFAEQMLARKDARFVHDRRQGRLLLDGYEVTLPAPGSTICDAYDRNQRLFMTCDTPDGRHFLYIITCRDGLDVRSIEIPWCSYFDTYHAGEEDSEFLLVPALDEFEYLAAVEEQGRWQLRVINTGLGVTRFAEYGIQDAMCSYWAYGTHPWNDLETLDWSTLPMSFEEAYAGLQNEKWLFPKEETPLYGVPDERSTPLESCAKETPVHVIRTEGDWAWVGVQATDYEPHVGYLPQAVLTDLPTTFIPGGEIGGWFCIMTVTDDRFGGGTMTFDCIDGYFTPMPVKVKKGFAIAAREIYRKSGFAATPAEFAPELLPYLGWQWGKEHITDIAVTEGVVLLAMEEEGQCSLCLVHETETGISLRNILMPGPFRFSDESIWNWQYAVEFIE